MQGVIEAANQDIPSIPLSKNGRNVVVLMLDRAISGYVPYLFHEKPELQKAFDGFTYYPNTISFGAHTNIGSPALYGGYEYSPEELNRRTDEWLVDKHNEALKVMPVLFLENGFNVTVADPSDAGYQEIPDLTIYNDYPEIHRYITSGKYTLLNYDIGKKSKRIWERDFFCYALMKCTPLIAQGTLYGEGLYNDLALMEMERSSIVNDWSNYPAKQFVDSMTVARGVSSSFVNDYAVLLNLPDISRIEDDGTNTFLMMANMTPHRPTLLQEPAYEPMGYVDNTQFEKENADRFLLDGKQLKMEKLDHMRHYQVNMATLIQLGKWFDWMREQDVYENTRIILVSDHGYNLKQLDYMLLNPEWQLNDVMYFNAFLMVKDFGEKGFKTDASFMCNADTPTLAVRGLIAQPVNPFTGKRIDSNTKENGLKIFYSEEWHTSINNGRTYVPGEWYSVRENIFDIGNWQKIEDPAQNP